MSNGPLVSIITPLYNQERYVIETILSVLSQTYLNIEYIVINDGSTDGSRSLIEKFNDRITIIDQDNQGQAATLNRGWEIAKGKYIGYLSSDDILYPQCIERVVKALEGDSSAVCAFPDCDLISSESKVLKNNVCRSFDLEQLVVDQRCHIGVGALWRASTHRQIGGWRSDLKLAPDREYWMRLANHGRFLFLGTTLAGYRLHPNSISSSVTSEDVSLEYVKVLDDYFTSKDIPPSILDRKSEAYAYAYWVVAGNMLRQGNIRTTARYIAHAHSIDPKSLNFRNLIVLARSSIGKPLRYMLGFLKRGVR